MSDDGTGWNRCPGKGVPCCASECRGRTEVRGSFRRAPLCRPPRQSRCAEESLTDAKKGSVTDARMFCAATKATSTENGRLATPGARASSETRGSDGVRHKRASTSPGRLVSGKFQCLAERVTAGLGVYAQAVRFVSDGTAREERAVAGIDRVNLRVYTGQRAMRTFPSAETPPISEAGFARQLPFVDYLPVC